MRNKCVPPVASPVDDGLMAVGFWGGLSEPFLIAVCEFRPKVRTQYLPRTLIIALNDHC